MVGTAARESRQSVKLGPDGLEAYRYENLQPDGFDRQVTLYLAPTSEGVATVACLAPAADAGAFKPVCDGVANTLQVASGEPLPVGADPKYADTVNKTFGALNDKVAKGQRALSRKGARFDDQAADARQISAAYAAAAKRLRNAQIRPADASINTVIANRLANTGDAWQRAARAAAAKDKAAFNRSEGRIGDAQQQLAVAVRALEDAGYAVGG
jgi:hypothetical protein